MKDVAPDISTDFVIGRVRPPSPILIDKTKASRAHKMVMKVYWGGNYKVIT